MVTEESKDEALCRYELGRQELVKQLKEKDEENQKLKDQLKEKEANIEWLESTRIYKFYFDGGVRQSFCITDEVYKHQRKLICDEIRTKLKADPSIAEDYFAVIEILDQVDKGDNNETNI